MWTTWRRPSPARVRALQDAFEAQMVGDDAGEVARTQIERRVDMVIARTVDAAIREQARTR